MTSLPSVLNYKSYREFLRDWFDAKKSIQSNFSHRRLAQLAGLKSPNFIHLVINGKRNLGLKSIPDIAKALKLKKYEEKYFDALVRLEQSSSYEEASKCINSMLKIRSSKGVDELGADLFKLYSKWENVLIREMVSLCPGKVTAEWLMESTVKHLTKTQVNNALNTLCEIGLLKVDEDHGYISTQKTIKSGDNIYSVALSRFQREMIVLATEAINTLDASRRESSSVTVQLSWEQVELVKQKIRELKNELIALEGVDRPEEVFQVNFQLFPMTRISKKMNLASGE